MHCKGKTEASYRKWSEMIDNRFLPLDSLVIAAAFVLILEYIYSKLVLISTIGLGAVGYQMTSKGGEK